MAIASSVKEAELNAAVAPGIKILHPTSPNGYEADSSTPMVNGMLSKTVAMSQNARLRTKRLAVVRRCSKRRSIAISSELLPKLAKQIRI